MPPFLSTLLFFFPIHCSMFFPSFLLSSCLAHPSTSPVSPASPSATPVLFAVSGGPSEWANGLEPVSASAEQHSESTAPRGHPLITQTRSHPLTPLLSLSHSLLPAPHPPPPPSPISHLFPRSPPPPYTTLYLKNQGFSLLFVSSSSLFLSSPFLPLPLFPPFSLFF